MSGQRHNPRECWCGIDHSRTPDAACEHFWDEDDLIPLPEHYPEKTRAILAKGGFALYKAWVEAGMPWPFYFTTITEADLDV